MLLCNVLPNVTDTSHGAWRRLVSVQFPTLFKEQPDPKKPNERPVDFAIDGKIEAWADVFLTHMLTRGYEVAKETGLNVPAIKVLRPLHRPAGPVQLVQSVKFVAIVAFLHHGLTHAHWDPIGEATHALQFA